jgi:hypothetical protein
MQVKFEFGHGPKIFDRVVLEEILSFLSLTCGYVFLRLNLHVQVFYQKYRFSLNLVMVLTNDFLKPFPFYQEKIKKIFTIFARGGCIRLKFNHIWHLTFWQLAMAFMALGHIYRIFRTIGRYFFSLIS